MHVENHVPYDRIYYLACMFLVLDEFFPCLFLQVCGYFLQGSNLLLGFCEVPFGRFQSLFDIVIFGLKGLQLILLIA